MSEITPVTHTEKVVAGQVEPITHFEKVIAEYGGGDVYENLVAGTNILIEETSDGKARISASGEVSSEDTVARADIAAIKDGETLDSFGDVETALAGKADTSDIPTVPITAIQKNGTGITPVSGTVNITVPTQASDINAATATQGGKADTAVQTIKVNSASTGVTKTGDTVDITSIPASIVSAGALANGMTATTQETSEDSTKLATTAFVHDVVDSLPSPMVYKGTLGTGGTKTTLPVDGTAEVGDTYKVITAGTYASQAAKVGDMFICLTKATSSNTWSYVPSGDDTDVTQVSAGTGLTTASGSPITTTGTIKAKLKSGTALAEAATNSTTSGKSYAVNVDSNGDLACNVPWTDTTYSEATTTTAGLMSAQDKTDLGTVQTNILTLQQRTGKVSDTQSIGTDYTLVSNVYYHAGAAKSILMTAALQFNNEPPRGIIISKSNNSSNFNNGANLIAKAETTESINLLSVTGIGVASADTTYYVWAKSAGESNNAVFLIYQDFTS